jgi:prolyl oligopeptidase
MKITAARLRQARACVAGLALVVAAASNAAPPVRDVAETLHGVTVHDPYRYMEDVKAPEVQSWLRGEGARARSELDRIAGRDAIQQRIAELANAAGDSVYGIVRMGEQLFYLKRPRGARQYKLVLREAGRERVLVDPERAAAKTGVPHAINYFVPSWDGRHVAYGLSAGGSEEASLHVLDVRTGEEVGEPIPRVHEAAVSWLPDSRSFTFNQLKPLGPEDPDTETYLDSRVMWLRVGAPASQARAVFGPGLDAALGLARLDVGAILFAPGSPWMVARTTDTTLPEGALYLARVIDLDRPVVPWRKIASPADQVVQIALKGDALFFRTHHDAPSYHVMKLDLRQAELARAAEVARPPAGGVLESFQLGRDALMARVREGTTIGLREYVAGNARGTAIRLPFTGAASLPSDPAHTHTDWLYTLSSWDHPAQAYRLAGGRSTPVPLAARASTALPRVVATEVLVPSHDGVKVPMTILHAPGLKQDGTNPTLLEGYGSYGFSMTAGFNAATLAWIERGGVLALANVRGSGVYGESWRLAGFQATKPNTWKDGIACAQYLIAHRYASPGTLGVMGTSAGGIFVGRAITDAPQLFAAAIINVGVSDAVRAEQSANGITNISEFGSAADLRQFPALLEMSPYHHVRDGVAYPATLLVHGLNDPRVDVWHSAKMAARLQAASTSGKPVLLRLDAQAGHGVGSTAAQRYALQADIYSFLLWQMGMAAQR